MVFGRPGRSLDGYSDYLENTRSYFLSCFVVIPNLKDMGECMGWTKRATLGFAIAYCAIEIYHRTRSLGESYKQLA